MPSSAPAPVPVGERLIFALDVPSCADARRLVDQLGDSVQFYKMGLELFTTRGYFELVDTLAGRGKKIFVDLKFLDIAETVRRAIIRLRDLGVTFTTIHPNSDDAMKTIVEAKGELKVLVVTVLTSLSDSDLRAMGVDSDVRSAVMSRARRAHAQGCDGVIASGLEAHDVRREVGQGFTIVTPGIRPAGERQADDQKRVVTPGDAFRNGADYIVVGRPIRDAADPRATAEAIQREIAAAF